MTNSRTTTNPTGTHARRLAVASALVAGATLGVAGNARALPALDAPGTIYYGLDGPATPVTVGFATKAAPSITRLELAETITDATCATGSESLATTILGGAVVIEADLAASTPVTCALDLGLAAPTTPPASTDIVVVESDVFGGELDRTSQPVDLTPVDITFDPGPIGLVGGVYEPYVPRAIGDELTYDLGVASDLTVPLTVTVSAGATVAGCASATTDAHDCVVSRALDAPTLAAQVAPMSATVYADGFPVAVFDGDVPVFAERRLGLDVDSSPRAARIGESVTTTVTLENQGSVELGGFVVTGGRLGTLACAGSPVSSLTLVPGAQATCTETRLMTADDLGDFPDVVARASSPVPGDSDLVDDDATSPDDVDAVAASPTSVSDSDISASLVFDDPVIWLPGPLGATGTPPQFVAEAELSVSTLGALRNARFDVSGPATSGISLLCAAGGSFCPIPIGDVAAESTATAPLFVLVDVAGLSADGVREEPVTARLVADGGIDVEVASDRFSTAGIVLNVDDDTVIDASLGSARVDLLIATLPGIAPDLDLALPDGTRLDSCTGGSNEPSIAARAASVELTDLEADTDYRCELVVTLDAADRASATLPMSITGVASVDGSRRDVGVDATLRSRSLQAIALEAPAVPADGYHPAGADGRADRFTVDVDVTLLGDATGVDRRPTLDAGDDTATCVGAGDRRWTCSIVHEVVPADLVEGSVDLAGTVELATADGDLRVDVSTRVDVTWRDLTVTLTEVSSPSDPSGYRLGEPIDLLVQAVNTGTMPITTQPIVIGGVTPPGRSANLEQPVTLDPGESADLAVRLVVDPAAIIDGSAAVTVSLGIGSMTRTATVRLRAVAEEMPPTPDFSPQTPIDPTTVELPATGAAGGVVLVTFGAALALLGLFLVGAGTTRRRLRVVWVDTR